jgi:hypothetical protein
VRQSDTIILRFNSPIEPVLLGLGFSCRGNKGGSKGPQEKVRAIERTWWVLLAFSSAESVLLGLGFSCRGSKGGSKGPQERESDRARVVGVCVVRRGVKVLKPRS